LNICLPPCAPFPKWREEDRLAALRDYEILDTETEEAFEEIVKIAAHVFQAPIAVVSFIAEGRQWFKAEIGLGIRETPLDISICAVAILQPGLFTVPDTTADERFSCNPLVTGAPGLRFYAGALLETPEGLPLGTVCVLDHEPRPEGASPEQASMLLALARCVMRELELKRSNKALARQTELLEAALQNMDQGILMVDAQDRVAVCNDRAIQLLDLPADLMRSQPLAEEVRRWQFAHAEMEKTDESLRRTLEEGGMERDPPIYERERPNGVVLEIRTVPLRFGGVVRTYTDITARKRTEEAVTKSEMRYRALTEAGAAIVWRSAPDGALIECLGWEAFCGQPIDEQRGLGWLDYVHSDDRDRVAEAWRSALKTGQSYLAEYRVPHVDGDYRWMSARGVPIKDFAGQITEWVGTVADIHDRKLADERLRDSEERLQLALATTGLAIWDFDRVTRLGTWSAEMCDILGLQRDTPADARLFLGLVHPEDRPEIHTELLRVPTIDETARPVSFRVLRADDGRLRWIEGSSRIIVDRSGVPVRRLGTFRDVTARKEGEQALAESEKRLRLALQAGRMFAWDRDLETDFVTRSDNAFGILGIPSGPVSEFSERLHPGDRARAPDVLRNVWSSDSEASELRYIHPDGRILWLSARSIEIAEAGKPRRLVGITSEISDRKLVEEKLWRAANHDALTNLPNRALFQQRLEEALWEADRTNSRLTLLLLDLDGFKDINDTLGHDAGDRVLVEAAGRLSAMIGGDDMVARLGGDEFAMLLLAASPDGVETLCQAVKDRLSEPFVYDGRLVAIRTSIGVASFPEHHREADELMKDADIALYQAKAGGRNRAVIYAPAAREAMEHRISVARDVAACLPEGQIIPFYQPKICLDTGRIIGFEALARWRHPTRGILTPGYFGSVFQEAELAIAIGDSIIRQVCSDVRQWLDQGLDCGRIAVNLSSAEFADPFLARNLLALISDAGVPASRFEVEITENVFFGRSIDAASVILKQFHDNGVTIALDDFGTGYASLTHVKNFPVDHIKIDQSFVRGLSEDEDDAAIVMAVISLGKSLNLSVTAEGVETAAQANRLHAMGCDFAQGYLYAKPLAGSRVPWLLENWIEEPLSRRFRTG